ASRNLSYEPSAGHFPLTTFRRSHAAVRGILHRGRPLRPNPLSKPALCSSEQRTRTRPSTPRTQGVRDHGRLGYRRRYHDSSVGVHVAWSASPCRILSSPAYTL